MKKIIFLIVLALSGFNAFSQTTCATGDCSSGSFFSMQYCITTPTCGGFSGDISTTMTTTMPNCTGCVEVLLTGTDNPNTRTSNVNISGGSAAASFASIPEGFYVLTVKTPIVPTPPPGSTATSYVCSKLIQINAVDQLVLNGTANNDPCPIQAPFEGSITGVSISGGTAPYTYDWADVAGTNNAADRSALAPGTYTVTARDANNCQVTRVFTIDEQKPTVSLQATPNPVCPPSAPFNINVTWTATPGATFTPGQYFWDGSSIASDAGQAMSSVSEVVTTYGEYLHYVVFQDINGCFSDSVGLEVPVDSKPTGTISPVAQSVCPGTVVTLTGTTTFCSSIGATPCVYSFDDGASYQPDPDNTFDVTVNVPTVVSMRIRNATGCVSDPIVANLDTLGKPQVIISADTVCPNTASNITLDFICTPVNCAGYQYDFNNNGPVPAAPTVTFLSPVVTGTTTFDLLVDGPTGCPLDTSVTVQVYPNQTSIDAPDDTVCANNTGPNGPVTLTAIGFATITSWSPGGETTPSITVIPSVNTTYTVTGVDLNGCTRTASQDIVSLVQPTVTAPPTPRDHCENTTTILNASGALTYTWHNSTFALLSSSNPFSVTPTASTNYNVIGTDVYGCKDTFNVVVNFRPKPTGTAVANPAAICAGNNSLITVTFDPGFTPHGSPYSYNGGGTWTGAAPPASIGPFTTTTIVNTRLRDIYNCESDLIPVTVTVAPFTAAISNATAACSYSTDGTALLTVTGGTPTYEYSTVAAAGPYTPFGSAGTTQVIPNLTPGPHTIYVRDAGNNCSTNRTFTVSAPAPLAIDTNVTQVRCKGETNGVIQAIISGGAANYNLYLNTMGTLVYSNVAAGSYNYSNLAGGVAGAVTYDLIVEDDSGCTLTLNDVPVNEPATALVAPAVTTQQFCAGTTGTFTMTPAATGGWGTYTYNFNGSAVALNGTVTGLAAGNYPLSVTDGNGCVASTTVTLSERPNPTGSASASSPSVCAGDTSIISISIDAPFMVDNPGYSYNGGTSYIASNSFVAGPFTADTTINTRIRDVNGCLSTVMPVPITVLPFTANVTGTSANCSYSTDVNATLTVTGGTPTYEYSLTSAAGPFTVFSTAGTTQTLNNLSAGPHTVYVRDAGNNCRVTSSFTITAPPALVFTSSTVTDVRCKGETNGSIAVNIAGGTSAYDLYTNTISVPTRAFDNVTAGAHTYTNLAGGVSGALTYDLIVEDANGCRDTITGIPVNEPAQALNAPVIPTSPFCYGTATGTFTLSSPATDGWGGYTYTFDGTSILLGATRNGLAAGTYAFAVTDSKGCTETLNVTLSASQELEASVTVVSADCGSAGSITFNTAGGGTSPFTYSLDGITFGSTPPSPMSPVTVNTTATLYVRDAQGCNDDTTVTVLNIPRGIPVISITPPQCPGGNDGIITIDSTHVKGVSGGPFDFELYTDASPQVAVGNFASVAYNASVDFTGLTSGNYIMLMSDPFCTDYVVDSFRVYTTPTTYVVVKAPGTGLNPEFAEMVVTEPAPFTVSSIALASDINQNTGTVILYNLTGGTMINGNAYDLAIDNPNSSVVTALKDTLGGQKYVSFANLAPGPHTIYIRDANCYDTILIQVPGKFFIPNLVTPNEDDANDVFEVVSLPDNSELRLYNRWGDRVFESSNYDNKYDFKGLSDGVYYYDLEFNTGTRFKGWVQVLR